MSRRSRRRQRDDNSVTTDTVLSDPLAGLFDDAPMGETLVDRRTYAPEDLLPPERFFSPEPFRLFDPVPAPAPARSVSPRSSVPPLNARAETRAQLSVCVRREQRREVLFALKRTGKGGARRHRRRTQWSNVKC